MLVKAPKIASKKKSKLKKQQPSAKESKMKNAEIMKDDFEKELEKNLQASVETVGKALGTAIQEEQPALDEETEKSLIAAITNAAKELAFESTRWFSYLDDKSRGFVRLASNNLEKFKKTIPEQLEKTKIVMDHINQNYNELFEELERDFDKQINDCEIEIKNLKEALQQAKEKLKVTKETKILEKEHLQSSFDKEKAAQTTIIEGYEQMIKRLEK